ncbi:MAG: permease prefix domain 1-containing protein [Gemmataceae bacterium]|nr:permease prefix domain 1-containing protein [Gemmataceae bacterium]
MNTSLELRMKRHIERIVRPVGARWQRKLRMREDLYAHLNAALDEESRQLPNEDEAFAAAVRRLGDPATLTHDLQTSVPRLDRILGAVQTWFGAAASESPARIALRAGATTWLLTVVGAFGTILAASMLKQSPPALRTGGEVMLVVSLWVSAWSASIIAVMVHVGRMAVHRNSNRRGLAFWIAALATMSFVPPAWTYWMTTAWDGPAIWGGVVGALVSVCIALGAGWMLGKELKQRHPWEGLSLSAE